MKYSCYRVPRSKNTRDREMRAIVNRKAGIALLLVASGAFLVIVGGIWMCVGLPVIVHPEGHVASEIAWYFTVFGGLGLAVGVALLTIGIELYPPLTTHELAKQSASDIRTWHFRPVGLVIILLVLLLVVMGDIWAEHLVPVLRMPGGWRRVSPFGYFFALLFCVLMGFRRVRDFCFYRIPARDQPQPEEGQKNDGLRQTKRDK
jgi:hypothetical protein